MVEPGSTRQQILKAAEEIMSAKGLENSSMAEIGEKTGISHSVIYHYFANKEDLLFSIPGERMKEVLTELSEQLRGIRDPVSSLSKMIWFHLNYNDKHRDYARLLLLECRSKKNFYKHEAYGLIRKYAGIMLGLLTQGVEKGVFRSDINLRIVRDIILGLLDWEGLSCLAAQEVRETVPDLDEIMSLLLPMITVSSEKSARRGDRALTILRAAETVFAEKGYPNATIGDIARAAGVADATIYEYFKNKQDLLFSIPEVRFQEHLNTLHELFQIKNPLRKMRRMMRYHFNLYLTQRNFLQVFLLSIQLSSRFYDSRAYEMFQHYTQTLDPILEDGKKAGIFRPEVNNRIFRNLFLGAFSHMALRWLIVENESKSDKMQEIDQAVSLLSQAVATEEAFKEFMPSVGVYD